MFGFGSEILRCSKFGLGGGVRNSKVQEVRLWKNFAVIYFFNQFAKFGFVCRKSSGILCLFWVRSITNIITALMLYVLEAQVRLCCEKNWARLVQNFVTTFHESDYNKSFSSFNYKILHFGNGIVVS